MMTSSLKKNIPLEWNVVFYVFFVLLCIGELATVLTLIYPAHFEDVPCQSGVNHIFEG